MKILLILTILISSCQDFKLITNQGVNSFKLGNILNKNYDKNIFDISTDKNGTIKLIIIKSKDYKTKSGFGVGSSVKKINEYYKDSIKKSKMSLQKGGTSINDIGLNYTKNNISFVDANENGKVDFVIIQKLK